MRMPRRPDLVLLRKRRDARTHSHPGLIRREEIDLESLHLPEDRFDLRIGEVVADRHHVRKEIEPRRIEFLPYFPEPIERKSEPPLPQFFAGLPVFGGDLV